MKPDNHYLKNELYSLVKEDSSIFDFLQLGSLDGLWYWDLQQPEHEWLSPDFWEVLGYDPSEKKHLASEWQEIIFPEDLEIAIDNFNKHCSDPEHPFDQVVRYRHKSGSTVWVRCRGIAIRDATDNPIRMLGAHTDLTQLKQTENALRESVEKYRKIFYEAQVAMFRTRISDGKLIDVNEEYARMAGYPSIEECKTNFHPGNAWVDKKSREKLKKLLKKNGSVRSYEAEILRADGVNIWISISATIYPENGYMEGSIEDITKRKDAYEELKDVNTALDVLLKKREKASQEIEENVFSNYELMIMPFLNKMKNTTLSQKQRNLLNIVETNIKEIISPFIKKMSNSLLNLTQSEIHIATMIKQGFTNKEIAQALNCSKRTIDTHRDNIRKKLDLRNKKVNLKTFLLNL